MKKNSLSQAEIIKSISDNADITQAKAKIAFDTVIDEIKKACHEERDVLLKNFASFKVVTQKGREGVSALTKKPFKTEDKKVVKIKSLPSFNDELNNK